MNIRTFGAKRNPQYYFPKMRGGVKGRLELFRKFIRSLSAKELITNLYDFAQVAPFS